MEHSAFPQVECAYGANPSTTVGLAMDTAQEQKASFGPDPLVGRRVGGRYHVKRLIGRGGMGLVYLADQPDMNRQVVVKMLSPHWASDDDAAARFDREAMRLSYLQHPNIVTYFDYGRFADRSYIVMEYVDGEPLRRYLTRTGKVSLEDFVPIASQILAGVGYVHSRRIMLRDIKPPNIMLCERDGLDNYVKLLDFGLAKLLEGEQDITKSHVVGTAGYLSPEQIKGEPIDLRVDVYALGILFYEMLAGVSPIAGENDGAVLYNHVHGTPRPLGEHLGIDHNVPQPLIDLIHGCLAKDPDDRPRNASVMSEVMFEVLPPAFFVLPTATDEAREARQEHFETAERDTVVELLDTADREKMARPGDDSQEWTRPLPRSSEDSAPSDPNPSYSVQRPSTRAKVGTALAIAAGAILALGAGTALYAMFGKNERDAVAAADPPKPKSILADPTRDDPSPADESPVEPAPLADADPAPSVPGDADVAAVNVTSTPVATVWIDDTEAGKTPFTGKLPIGSHRVRITAEGYQSYDGALEVAAADNSPLDVVLLPVHGQGRAPKRGGRRGRRGRPDATPSAAPPSPPPPPSSPPGVTETPKPEPKAEPKPPPPKPEPKPKAKPKKKPGGGVFLPTSKDQKDDIFLPVGK